MKLKNGHINLKLETLNSQPATFQPATFSPDRSGKPFAGLLHFFLAKKSDLGSYFFALEKSNKTKKLGTESGNSFLKKT
jgi:hypothetical protein